jgi:hypothetical protein
VEVGAGDNYRKEYRPQGDHIGWLDGEDIYLQADAAYAVVQRLARDQEDNISITLPTLKRRLRDQRLLASTDKHMADGREVERMEVRRDLQGKRRRVLHFNYTSLATYASESEPSEPQQGVPSLYGSQNGSHPGSQTAPAPGFVSQKSEPDQAPSVSEDKGSGSLGSRSGSIGSSGTGKFDHNDLITAWNSQGRPEITLNDGSVVHDLVKFLNGSVSDAALQAIKDSLY